MDILKAFVFDHTPHEVCILHDGDGDPLFRASDIGKILSIKNIRTSTIDFHENDKVLRTTNTPGGKQEVVYLTEQGALTLIMRSRKPIAKPFQKWVFNVIKTIRKTGKYELQNEIAQMKEHHANLFREYKDTEDERLHKTLVEGFDNKTVVYFGKIKSMDDGRVLIKIGCTKNIRPRTTGLQMEFGSISIFKIFECDNHEPFERFLHGHIDVSRYSYKELINGTKRSHEVFCMTDGQVKRAVNIATRNVSQFRVNKKRDFDDLVDTNPTVRALCEKVGIPVNDDIDAMDVQYRNKRGRCTLSGPKYQAYTEDGTTLIRTYETLIDAVRDLISKGGSQVGIRKACTNKTVKYGYRWAQLDRSETDDTIQDMGETVQEVSIRTGLVAGINNDKSQVMKVYTSFKSCALENGFTSQGAVQKRVKRGASVGGHHIVQWSDVPESIQDNWLENNALPEIASNATCIKINRLDPVTLKVLRTYATMNEVKIHFKMGQHALKNAIRGDLVKHGFKWAYAE